MSEQTMERKGPPASAQEACALAARWQEETDDGRERHVPYLYCWDDKGDMTVAALDVGGGAEVAWAARLMVKKVRPRVAALALETWTAHLDMKERARWPRAVAEWVARREAGLPLPVSALPARYRGDGLHVVAEDDRRGTAVGLWDIYPPAEPGAGRPRRYRAISLEGGKMDTRFLPLFGQPDPTTPRLDPFRRPPGGMTSTREDRKQ